MAAPRKSPFAEAAERQAARRRAAAAPPQTPAVRTQDPAPDLHRTGAPAPPALEPSAAAIAAHRPAADDLRTVHVLISTGSEAFDELLAGTAGALDPTGHFQIDADYAHLSPFFGARARSALPALPAGAELLADASGDITAQVGERAIALSLPEPAARALKASLIETSAERWAGFYRHRLRETLPKGLSASILEEELARLQEAVQRYLAGCGLAEWEVPVVYRTRVHEENPVLRPADERRLLRTGRDHAAFSRDIYRPIAPRGAPPGQRIGHLGSALPDNWLAHAGPMDLTAEGTIPVRAATAIEAGSVASAILLVARHSHIVADSLRPLPHSIQAVELLPGTPLGQRPRER